MATMKIQKVQYFEIQTECYHSAFNSERRWNTKKKSNCLYSDILKCKRKTSEHNALANKPNRVEQLKSFNINNKGESPSKSTSSTSQSQEKSLKQQIKQFQQEVYYL